MHIKRDWMYLHFWQEAPEVSCVVVWTGNLNIWCLPTNKHTPCSGPFLSRVSLTTNKMTYKALKRKHTSNLQHVPHSRCQNRGTRELFTPELVNPSHSKPQVNVILGYLASRFKLLIIYPWHSCLHISLIWVNMWINQIAIFLPLDKLTCDLRRKSNDFWCIWSPLLENVCWRSYFVFLQLSFTRSFNYQLKICCHETLLPQFWYCKTIKTILSFMLH